MKPTLLIAITLAAAPASTTAQTEATGAKKDPAATQLELARTAHEKHQHAVMWKHLDLCLKKLPAAGERPSVGAPASKDSASKDSASKETASKETACKAPLRAQLATFLRQLEPLLIDPNLHQARTKTRVQALLQPVKVGQRRSKSAAIEEILVHEQNADAVLREHARKNGSHARRLMALAALERRGSDANHRFVMRTAVLDRSEHVRKKVIDILRPGATDRDVYYLATGLGHSSAKVRMRTADALGNLGRKSAIDLLVKAGPTAATGLASDASGTQTRGHVAFLNQRSYIRDFSVEVASAAFIADPQVDVLQEGAVLDATVMGVQQVRTIRKYYRRALKQLSGTDPGRDVTKWARKMARARK